MKRLLVRLIPPSHRDWGRALLAESVQLSHRADRIRWLLGGVSIVARSWYEVMTGGNLMRTVLMTLSATNVMFGAFVGVLYLLTDAPPSLMLALALGLFAQGGYTLWFLSRAARHEDVWPTNLLLVGETLALMIGLGSLVISVVNNVNPVGGDHEYGPMAVAGLIAAHAFVALFIHAVREDAPQT